ncbi:SBBP repeat beta-propeller lipoprotein, LipL53 family [Leptospira noguchii]|uniref:SBBP repeat beta-propeller lipoprotein, LipL53 family n=1 Tax=Leptospira noguchii TaxID=28182 RepID=UPI001FB65882|nr:SBBP repeat-containing protein [Leptospira noguchii]UOG29279.1 SBBP repeat-containing protein [Leptospira noguchii]
MFQIYIFVFVFTFFQNCNFANMLGIPRPESDGLWMQFVFRENAEIIHIDHFPEENGIEEEREEAKNFELKQTIITGVPHANTNNKSITVDENGFIYVAGDTNGELYIARKIGMRDLTIIKYDSRMNQIWAKQIGNAGVALEAKGIAVDRNGNIFVTGFTDGNFPRVLSGRKDLFLMKFGSNGNLIWSEQKGYRNGRITPNAITIDRSGSSYIVGETDSFSGNSQIGHYGFIIKFKWDGGEDWRRHVNIQNTRSHPTGVAFDRTTNSVFMVGHGTANYLNGTNQGIGTENLFIYNYDEQGNQHYFTGLGSALGSVTNCHVTIDPFGNILVGAKSNARFDPLLGGNNFLGTILKHNIQTNNQEWIRQFGPIDNQAVTEINGITTDENGNIYTIGYSTGNVLDDGRIGSIGRSDVFLAKHDSSGQIEFIRRIATPGATITASGISSDSRGNTYGLGHTNSSINGSPLLGSQGAFIVRYR